MSLRLPDPSNLDVPLELDATGGHEAAPESSSARARETDDGAGTRAADRGGAVNVAVQGNPNPNSDRVTLTDEGYVGDDAGATGRLAAALTVADGRDDVAVQFPEPDLTAEGPWLVLAPLSGFLTTVATGVGRAVVTLEYDADADPTLDVLDTLVSASFDAARPTHEHYPVADDDLGLFTTGMTTFSLASVDVAGDADALEVTFSVSTTPATTTREIEARFDAVDAVRDVAYNPVAGVTRASPSATLRDAVELAHREIAGDAQYDWLTEGGVFARIPTCEKVAFGPGSPGDDAFTHEAYATCVGLLEATLGSLTGEGEARSTE